MIMEKEVFERMLSEFNELNERVTNCREFLLDEEKSKVLDALNRDLLVAQLKAMEAYLSILSVRIGLNAPREEFMQPADTEETVVPEAVND
jgi:hypothetical protein